MHVRCSIMALSLVNQFQKINRFMHKQIRGHLINFFRELIQSQKSLQYIRKQLNIMKNFHPISLFRKIAGSNQVITTKLMASYVKGKIACNDKELYDLFQKFDHKRNGYIQKQDFCRELHPSKKKLSKGNDNIFVNYQIQKKFLEYLSTIIKSTRVLDVWRKQIELFEPYKIFEALDTNLDGKIGVKQLERFFYKSQQSLNIHEARFLYQILLRRHYKQVNLEVFCENLNPRQFGGYQAYQAQVNRQAEAQIQEKLQRQKEAAEAQKNFHKQLNNQKVVQLVHKEASLIRQKQLQDRIKDEIEVYKDLRYITRKKYHPQLTYEQFLRIEKQNLDRLNLERKLLIEEELRKQALYKQRLLHVDVVRQVQAFERSKLQRLPFMIMKNRIDSKPSSLVKAQLEDRIKKHTIDRLNRQNRTPLSRDSLIRQEALSFCRRII